MNFQAILHILFIAAVFVDPWLLPHAGLKGIYRIFSIVWASFVLLVTAVVSFPHYFTLPMQLGALADFSEYELGKLLWVFFSQVIILLCFFMNFGAIFRLANKRGGLRKSKMIAGGLLCVLFALAMIEGDSLGYLVE